ncbi:MAG: hypothetical protein LLG40_08230 [Deltaproteobacteria bacterium]|nr:hypothetical protein [Deltaproteobacteria bacterium]
MRYINIQEVCASISREVTDTLDNKQQQVVAGNDEIKEHLIDNGNATWRQVKPFFEDASNRKCWYTESKNPGCPNDVDHFRPAAKKLDSNGNIDYWYWFLAFDPENYRLSCNFPNRPTRNPIIGLTGGKWQEFPLINGQIHATTKEGIAAERPVLLDPCNEEDCKLLEFQPDGRPVVAAIHNNDVTICERVEKSKLLLNLDFPTFNEDREILYNKIRKLVKRGDRHHQQSNPALEEVKHDLRELMAAEQQYSKAAECYIRCFRNRDWIEELL